MRNQRIIYILATIVTIAIGLGARIKKVWFPDIVNVYLGDSLYAVMMYFIVGFIMIRSRFIPKAAIALGICYCIEFSQLYNAAWINSIRSTLPGKLVFGNGFLWSDLMAYAIGIAAACMADKYVLRQCGTNA